MTLLSPNVCSPYSLFPGCQRAPVRPGCAQAAAVREDSALSVPRPAYVPSGWKLHPPTLPSHGGPPGPLANRSWHVGARGPKGRPFRAVASVGYPSAVLPLQPDHKGVDRGWWGANLTKTSGAQPLRACCLRVRCLSLSTPECSAAQETFYGAGDVVKTPLPPRTTDVAVVPRPVT